MTILRAVYECCMGFHWKSSVRFNKMNQRCQEKDFNHSWHSGKSNLLEPSWYFRILGSMIFWGWFWRSGGKSTYCIMIAGLVKRILKAWLQTKQEQSETSRSGVLKIAYLSIHCHFPETLSRDWIWGHSQGFLYNWSNVIGKLLSIFPPDEFDVHFL